METLSKFSVPAMGLALTLAFGFWLSKLGKPYSGILFNVHKLIALGTVVFAVLQISKTMDLAGQPLLIAALIVAGLCAVALFASGTLMSMVKLDYALTLTVHRIAPIVLVIAMAVMIYLFTGKIHEI